jgi:hypothetical protein
LWLIHSRRFRNLGKAGYSLLNQTSLDEPCCVLLQGTSHSGRTGAPETPGAILDRPGNEKNTEA